MIDRFLHRNRLRRGIGRVSETYLARPFRKKDARRMVIYHNPTRISYSQIYPFLHYQDEIFDRFRVEIRCCPIEHLLAGNLEALDSADIVLLQPWFTVDPDSLRHACDAVARVAPQAQMSFLDSFAHSDLRLSAHLPEELRFYIKKSLLKDQRLYQKAWRGDTQLTDYYIGLYGLDGSPVDFETPDWVLPKLRLCPNFFTAPHLMPGFSAPAPPPQTKRQIDVQTRLGVKGSPWYAQMRKRSMAILDEMPGLATSSKQTVPLAQYMKELRESRLCFSPFGYGELCWRDIEAIQTGAVLIKQDMSRLHTLPELYEANVTYMPVQWDFSNLAEVIETVLADDSLRTRITTQAYTRVHEYLDTARFVDDMAFLFEEGA